MGNEFFSDRNGNVNGNRNSGDDNGNEDGNDDFDSDENGNVNGNDNSGNYNGNFNFGGGSNGNDNGNNNGKQTGSPRRALPAIDTRQELPCKELRPTRALAHIHPRHTPSSLIAASASGHSYKERAFSEK